MTPATLKKSALLTAFLIIAFISAWEMYLRSQGLDHSFDDGPALWSFHRDFANMPMDEATVFIGSSRIKFDLDIPTWEHITGERAIQLAYPGSSPLPHLYELADDPDFKGKLIIDVTEVLFFSEMPSAVENPNKNIAYYKDITPTQKASFEINKPLEKTFVFLDKDRYSLNAMLDKLELKSRPGVFMFPVFPPDFGRSYFNRQEYMTDRFVADTNLQNQVKGIWVFFSKQRSKPPISGESLDSLLQTVKVAVDKIEQRGGKVAFVRTPSSGPFWEGEQKGYPREKYWDRLLAYTGKPGIHFMDFPETDHYQCPELSHLSPADAIDYTKHLVRQVDQLEGWDFSSISM